MSTSRHSARIAAVQAVYQMMYDDVILDDVISQFFGFHFKKYFPPPHRDLFKEILTFIVHNKDSLNHAIQKFLKDPWTMDRVLPISLCILYCGVAETEIDKKTPISVLINEYVEIAKRFLEKKDVGFIHTILDKAGQRIN